jgi:cytochrome c oxidase subunit 1
LYFFGSIMATAGFLTPGGAASFGWTAYAPLSNHIYSPGIGADLWIVGLAVSGLGTILGGVNFVTTIFTMRAPGMTMFRMSIFSWNTLLTAILILIAFPPLAAALLALESDRLFGSHIFDPANGGAMLWQHIFWFFGHPEVYILALPFFGIVTEILPVFSRKPIFGNNRYRCALSRCLGAPYVRKRPGRSRILLIYDLLDCRPNGSEVLQLDWHYVERLSYL